MKSIIQCVLPLVAGEFSCLLPPDADFIHCGNDELDASMWFVGDSKQEKLCQFRFFLAFGNQEVPDWCTSTSHVASIHARWPTRGWVLLHVFRGSVGEANGLKE